VLDTMKSLAGGHRFLKIKTNCNSVFAPQNS